MSASIQAVPSHQKIRCLVIQLARLGDTLQSLMALRAAKQLYPQLEIHFLARERFSGAAKRVPWIHNVITLPTDDLLSPVITGQKSEAEALKDLARWVSPLVSEGWDLVVNWSYSQASSYLTGLTPARVKLGYSRRRDSSFTGVDGWSHYIQAVVQGGIHQNIHLTDILTTQLLTALQIHAGDPLPEGNSSVTSKSFFSLKLSENQLNELLNHTHKRWIAIQLGAGKDSKTWNPKHWAKLAQYILERHPECEIFLLGGHEDSERARLFIEEISPFIQDSQRLISLVGQTDFDLWASVVSRCQWLFAGDTAALHLASILGTRILNISVGPVRHTETGPYGNGHYVITSAIPCEACEACTENANPSSASTLNHTCGDPISPQAAYTVWSYATNEWAHRRQISLESHFAQLGWSDHLSSVRVYRSRIRNSDDGGGVNYESMIKRPLQLEDWTAQVMGHVARTWYCGWVPSIGQELSRDMISPPLIQKLRELQESTEAMAKICDQAHQAALALHRKSAHLKSEKVMGLMEKEELRILGKALLDLEALVERVAKTQSPLLAFSQMSKVLMHNLKGSQISDLGRETADCYRQLYDGVSIFKEWIKFTLDIIKPVALKPTLVSSIEEGNRQTPNKELSP